MMDTCSSAGETPNDTVVNSPAGDAGSDCGHQSSSSLDNRKPQQQQPAHLTLAEPPAEPSPSTATTTITCTGRTPTRIITSLSQLTLSNDSHPLMLLMADGEAETTEANRNDDAYFDDDTHHSNRPRPAANATSATNVPDLMSCSSSTASTTTTTTTTTGTRPKRPQTSTSTTPSRRSGSKSPFTAKPQPAPAAIYAASIHADHLSVSMHASSSATTAGVAGHAADTSPLARPAASSALRRIPVDAALLSDDDDEDEEDVDEDDVSSIDTSSPQHSFDEHLDDEDDDDDGDVRAAGFGGASHSSLSSSVLNEAAGVLQVNSGGERSRLVPPPDSSAAAAAAAGGKVSPIPQYLAADEARDTRHWRRVTLANGEQREIDMRVIEPYQRVLSHGGYLSTGGRNAIVVFSACHLPEKSRRDYQYVMDNLFLYVVKTLEQLITDDYVLVYLHGGASRTNAPTFHWLRSCYQLLDRRLRKSMRTLYIVHPSVWLKSMVVLMRPFISRKFWRKLVYAKSLDVLYGFVPLEKQAIPEKVKRYDDKYA